MTDNLMIIGCPVVVAKSACLVSQTMEDTNARLQDSNNRARASTSLVSHTLTREVYGHPLREAAFESQPRTTASLSTMPILPLQTLNQLHVLLLRLLGFDSLIVDFLPGAAFGFFL